MSYRKRVKNQRKSGVVERRRDKETHNAQIVSEACDRFFKSRGIKWSFVPPASVIEITGL